MSAGVLCYYLPPIVSQVGCSRGVENLDMAEKLNPHWPLKDEARNGEWRVDDENLAKRANGAESFLLLQLQLPARRVQD
jgi:hypothetical protein